MNFSPSLDDLMLNCDFSTFMTNSSPSLMPKSVLGTHLSCVLREQENLLFNEPASFGTIDLAGVERVSNLTAEENSLFDTLPPIADAYFSPSSNLHEEVDAFTPTRCNAGTYLWDEFVSVNNCLLAQSAVEVNGELSIFPETKNDNICSSISNYLAMSQDCDNVFSPSENLSLDNSSTDDSSTYQSTYEEKQDYPRYEDPLRMQLAKAARRKPGMDEVYIGLDSIASDICSKPYLQQEFKEHVDAVLAEREAILEARFHEKLPGGKLKQNKMREYINENLLQDWEYEQKYGFSFRGLLVDNKSIRLDGPSVHAGLLGIVLTRMMDYNEEVVQIVSEYCS